MAGLRDVYMALPRELGLPKNFVCKQMRYVYGTRGAGIIWEETNRQALLDIGFTAGREKSCCPEHPERQIAIVVHGDDFIALGKSSGLDWYEAGAARCPRLISRAEWPRTPITKRCESSIGSLLWPKKASLMRWTPDTINFL